MKLKKIKIENFKKVANVELDLADLNVMVGVNASGKSSVLQAIHLASCLMRQADRIRYPGTSPVSINELDYLPTNSYAKLGHDDDWGNRKNTPCSIVRFEFESSDNTDSSAFAEFRSARNAGISVSATLPEDVRGFFRGTGKFFTAYIPGISGIPNEEQKQSKRVVLKACSFGDANVYLRNALLLLEENEINKLETWLSELIGPVSINVDHNDDKDLAITATADIDGNKIPLELLGMGFLQLIQIFCYLLLFKPHVMLIDEPDIHLHPNVQEKLSYVLSDVAKEQGIKIILSTHSPFIVRGAPIDANIFWMNEGGIQNSNRNSVELALGWGAFGKKIIIFSEDTKTDLLKHIIAQWPEIEKYVAIHPGNGHSNLLTPKQAEQLKQTLGNNFKIVIHRDRDSMIDKEVAKLSAQYKAKGVSLWVTDNSDIESYFCEASFLHDLLGDSVESLQNILDNIIKPLNSSTNEQFVKQRKSCNDELYAGGGGSPSSDVVWQTLQSRPLKSAIGKAVFNKLKNKIQANKFSDKSILLHNLDGGIAISLKSLLTDLLKK